ncbi:TonB-dependent receptor [Desertivirga brevis]|uniref:TonB-dependent receptor n=1 Tax=Desertivirga brevis TaxID=2810310 RepID=UPI001A963945|nr:TonB-dependent receptor [Pedobacter sp. SYSU D00873]
MKFAEHIFLQLMRFAMFALLLNCVKTVNGQPSPSYQREVSGIVKDSVDDAVVGAIVVLKTERDSLKLSTNNQGVFIFRGVSAGQFILSVRSIGYRTFNKRYLYNDNTKQIILNPIILRNSTTMLSEVQIKSSALVLYKGDTTEYRASDYKVKPNAYIEDLLKKMDGIEVSKNGSVSHQGVPVQKARLNGQNYAGGNIANAIRTLPAEIVEKIQMIDEYGEQAEQTGIKDKEPERVLNIVTRRDKSVGNRLQTDVAGGNKERYDGQLNFTRLNLNEQIVSSAGLNKSISGITASAGDISAINQHQFPGSGTSNAFKGSLGYSDRPNQRLRYSFTYTADNRRVDQLSSSFTNEYNQRFGQVLIENNTIAKTENAIHALNTELKWNIDSANYISFSPFFSYTDNNSFNSVSAIQMGGIRQNAETGYSGDGSTPNYGFSSVYAHSFHKRGRAISASLSFRSVDADRQRDTDNEYIFYDALSGNFLKDSVASFLSNFTNSTTTYNAGFTFSEPLTTYSKIEFNSQINARIYSNRQLIDQEVDGVTVRSDSLSRIFNYSFLEQRYSLNYRYIKGKYNLSLGVTGLPTLLQGRSESLATKTRRTTMNFVPLFRSEYQWSKLKVLSVNYYGTLREPGFEQIQSVPDVSNPQNIIIGNPRLKPEFRHSVNTRFSTYLANSRINITLDGRVNIVNDKIVRDIIEVDQSRGRRRTYFENRGRDLYSSLYYDISKQFRNTNYKIKLSGRGDYSKSPSLLNNNLNFTEVTGLTQNIGCELNPVDWLELFPGFRYSSQRIDLSAGNDDYRTRILGLTTSGRVDFASGFFLKFDASKSYIKGLQTNANKNPFIINSSISKEFFNRRGTVKIETYDLLNQNNFVLRRVNINSITDYRSNISSRYFMFGLTYRLQKWTPAPTKNGKELNRRGDGSFIN